MGTPEFPNLGKHCSVDDCKLIDFLPFTCDGCKKVFCLNHRSYTEHRCPNANLNDVTVLVCPLCAKGVRVVPNQDPNITWDRHTSTDCDPSNYEKATKKQRCPVPGCREHLTFSNKIMCRDCSREHCLKHRFGPDHKCPGPKRTDSLPGMMGLLSIRERDKRPSSGSSWWTTSLQKISDAVQKAKDGMAGEGPAERQRPKAILDVCPKCGKAFRDAVMLVEHVEKEHRGSSRV